MTTFDYIYLSSLAGILLGMFIAWLVYRKRISNLEFNNETLLDFNEKLTRELEAQTLASKGYIAHLDSHVCMPVPREEEWPEVIG